MGIFEAHEKTIPTSFVCLRPSNFTGKCVYFIKNAKRDIKNLYKNRSDNVVFVGEIARENLLTTMDKTLSEVTTCFSH